LIWIGNSLAAVVALLPKYIRWQEPPYPTDSGFRS